jgi:hypothetical protein
MVLFWRLLLAHCIADFPLQSDAVFAVKKRFKWGVVLHGTLFLLTTLLLTGPYLRFAAMWAGIIFLWLFHVAVDKAKLMLVGGGRRDHLGYFLLDQVLHIGAIALVFFFLTRHLQVASATEISPAIISQLKLGVAYILSIWASPLLSYYVRGLFRPQQGSFKTLGGGLWRTLGYVERGALTAVVIHGGRLLILAPLVFLPRIILPAAERWRGAFLWDLVLGSSMAIVLGIWGKTF